ncbi:MAG: Gfo/Idh/MocA family oxidoreductase [Devosiaceae bacterium]|nr:Gfo/Idh/MocA family oxidoreductase [Devosiaceae bacterium MH13]
MADPSTQALNVGIIGCGNVSATYLRLAPLFAPFTISAVADLNAAAAQDRAQAFGTKALSVDALLADPSIDIIVNLTVPAAHASVTSASLEAGKHVYSEKPLALSSAEARAIAALATQRGLRVGAAPDTFLGGAHQAARSQLDGGAVGRITSGTCHVMNHGMESWHPYPDFFFKPGAGPIFDIGPYYLTSLVGLLGPVERVAALSGMGSAERTIGSQPRAGERITVETPTDIHALLAFESGASITLSASWDVWAHGHQPMELYGTAGTLYLPDPNFFGGAVQHTSEAGAMRDVAAGSAHPFAPANENFETAPRANYRGAGLADMAQAIIEDRPHRCSLDLTVHVVEVMEAILKSGEEGTFVPLQTRCERPAPLSAAQAQSLLR